MSNFTLHDGVAVITLDHPPVNSLSHALRRHIGVIVLFVKIGALSVENFNQINSL
ncbi:hypothetical protein LP417_23215 [Polaromonas sp. P1-6]|nr:hypothetical protein LP417_23215 [Polaromonas sp. P1-6]